ncbi:MAG TPA: hypothetical protein VMS96_02590 [Terriglobales bacterium]|nr:hypothetical protein [Terriglobales bacterium]
MDWKRSGVAFLLMFVLTAVASYVIHGMLLHPDYSHFPSLLRTVEDANRHFVYLLAAFAVFSLAFVLVWALWVPKYSSPVRAGLFYGIVMWLVESANHYLINYAVQPWPADVVGKQVGYEFVWLAIMGMVLGAVYRK